MSADLAALAGQAALETRTESAGGFVELPLAAPDGWVTIDAVAATHPRSLEAELIALGARDTAVAGRLVSARLPVASVPFLESVASLQFARPASRTLNVGAVTSQGDHVMRADVARTANGLDGTGVKVGVLSDSFNCLSGSDDDAASGDLPATVTVVQEDPGCSSGTDEGRAMLQIVHDVAPGAGLAFATANGGQASFANNIRALRNAGAKVIVDDVLYFAEPMFQDGVVAQAVDEVTASGVSYFSSAGNNARKAYDHAFVPGQFLAAGTFGSSFLGGTPHSFGSSIMQRIAIRGGARFTLALQWDSPFFSVGGPPGTQNDLDVYLLVQNSIGGFSVTARAVSNDLASGDPFESLGPVSCSAAPGSQCVGFIVIVVNAGPNPGRLKYALFTRGGNPTLTPAINSGTIYGHANALGATAVGAASYKTPTTLETFSSGGTTPVLFDTSGDPLASPDPRQFKPEIVAPDGVDTTFFGTDTDGTGFPNFFGTSAAAPHAAGVAALLRQALPTLTPEALRTALETTALNMGPAGFDNNSGFGLIQTDAALGALHQLTISAGPSGTPNPVKPGAVVGLSLTATDSFDHTLTYAWTSTCSGGIAAGTFDNAALGAPKWTAPVNATGASQTCALKVSVDDGHGITKSATHTETVLSVARLLSVKPPAAQAGTSIVIAGAGLVGATLVTFSGPVSVVPTAVTATSVQAVVPAGARTGVISVTTGVGVGPSTSLFKLLPKITGFAPSSAVGGSATVVTVSGTNLRAVTGEAVVKIGAFTVPAGSIVSSTPTELKLRVPLGAVTGKIGVTTVDGTAASATSLTVEQPPRATAFAPAAGLAGTLVKITGTNLTGATLVTFGGAAAVVPTAVTATSLQAVVPAGAQTGPVSITSAIGTGVSAGVFKVPPAITGFTPSSAVGGSATIVTVSGTNLRAAIGAPVVKIGAFTVPAGSIVSSTPTELKLRVPLGAVTGKIGVTTVDGTATSATDLTVVQPPRPTGFVPAAGLAGTLVKVTGTNLTGASLVTFGGGATTVPTAVTATSLQVVIPAGALAGPIAVTNAAATGVSATIFKVLPVIAGFTPDSAVGGSATQIEVSGTALRAVAGEPAVKIGAFLVPPASIVSSTPTLLKFRVPVGAVTAKIGVTTAGGTAVSAANLTVAQPPRATAFAPASGLAGTVVKIAGTNLTGATLVTFGGGVTSVPTAVTATSLQALVPVGAVTGPVGITNSVGTGVSAVSFKVPPAITGFTPGSAVGGSATEIEVSGTNLRAATGEPVVKVGAFTVPAGSIVSSTPALLSFRVPLGAVTGKISLTTVDGAAVSASDLAVVQPPRATAFTPATGPAGTSVKISGTNLTGATVVTFGGGATATPTAVTATSLQVVVPAAAQTGPVAITSAVGTGVSAASFKVLPKITGFTPASASLGSSVVVTGTNLKAGVDPLVKVGAVAAAVVASSPTTVTFTVPALAVSGLISITTADGTAVAAAALTVTP